MKNLVSLILLHGKGLIEKETDYITNFKCKPSFFYGLRKIHKSKIINEACKQSTGKYINIQTPEDLTLRSIVAGPACETHRLSNSLDILLKPLLKYIKSFIRDDLDMLEHIPKTINKEAVLVTLDIINLYTNIPHDYGMKAIKFWLEKYPEVLPERINQTFMIESLKCILQNNYFLFDDTYYRQKCGIAMDESSSCSCESNNWLF
ncbi:uncharacterized protein LOC115222314 [Octopus sinensis]|uniref:Uncharacterized protein LOC115222314 n=1 Tax=Octopus sinensis TaxID=2607531 RepID=A0A6P7TG51_9MOLL|nr:uncharacterized protein LOC115222314 [Octopus sinensis]